MHTGLASVVVVYNYIYPFLYIHLQFHTEQNMHIIICKLVFAKGVTSIKECPRFKMAAPI